MKLFLGLLAVCALLTGCADRKADSHPSPSTSPATSTSTSPVRKAVTEASWQRIERTPRADGGRTIKTNGDYRAAWPDADPGSGTEQPITVTDVAGRTVFERPATDPAYFVQDAWLTESYLVVEEIDDQARLVRMSAYELPSGRAVRLPKAVRPTQPAMDAGFGRVAFVGGTADTRMCVLVLDLGENTVGRAGCEHRGDVLGDVAVGRDRVLFSSVTDPNMPSRCKTLFTSTTDGRTEKVPTVEACIGWSGATSDGTIMWDEMNPASQTLELADGYVATGDGRPEHLGPVATDTVVSCGAGFFWSATDGRGTRIDHRDSSGRIATVWKPRQDVVPLGLACTDGRWLTMRTDDLTGKDEHFSYYALEASD